MVPSKFEGRMVPSGFSTRASFPKDSYPPIDTTHPRWLMLLLLLMLPRLRKWSEKMSNAKSERTSFKVTHADCKFDYIRASGKGGQNVNKRDTKVRCTHPPSGAVAVCQEHREQHRNKVTAFQKMAATPEFQKWARLEAARLTGKLAQIEQAVEDAMRPHNIEIEVKRDGKWTKVREDELVGDEKLSIPDVRAGGPTQ